MLGRKNIGRIRDAETIIGPSVKVKGNFNGNGNIIIEGQLEGSLKTNGSVFIGEKSKISANIEAKEAVVNGQVEGNLKIKKSLNLGGTAVVSGDITCLYISVEKGATINGHLSMSPDKDLAPDLTPKKEIEKK